jgi:ankyrin repeat protein
LHDAIEHGHVELAQTLIEQALDMSLAQGLLNQENQHGQTPFLLAAKHNQWSIMEIILRKRSDLIEHRDKNKNNFIHLLADCQHLQTIEKILLLLPNRLKQQLLTEKNQANQRPVDIAQSHCNTQCTHLLHCSTHFE